MKRTLKLQKRIEAKAWNKWRWEKLRWKDENIETAAENVAKRKLKNKPKRRRQMSRVWLCEFWFHESFLILKSPKQMAITPARSKMLY